MAFGSHPVGWEKQACGYRERRGFDVAEDKHWMEKAVAQARLCHSEEGKVSPKVGAVVVDADGSFGRRMGLRRRGPEFTTS